MAGPRNVQAYSTESCVVVRAKGPGRRGDHLLICPFRNLNGTKELSERKHVTDGEGAAVSPEGPVLKPCPTDGEGAPALLTVLT